MRPSQPSPTLTGNLAPWRVRWVIESSKALVNVAHLLRASGTILSSRLESYAARRFNTYVDRCRDELEAAGIPQRTTPPEPEGSDGIRCYACGSDEPMATHRCQPSAPAHTEPREPAGSVG